jgi:hypothetical protein
MQQIGSTNGIAVFILFQKAKLFKAEKISLNINAYRFNNSYYY